MMTRSPNGNPKRCTVGTFPTCASRVLILFLLSAFPAFAQASSGAASISGQVTDASGGVMPGVDVQVRNIATNAARTLQSNEVGRYEIVALQPGDYEITAGKTRIRHLGAKGRHAGCRPAGGCGSDHASVRHDFHGGRRCQHIGRGDGQDRREHGRQPQRRHEPADERPSLGCLHVDDPGCVQRRRVRPDQLSGHVGTLQQQHDRRHGQQPGLLLRGERPHPPVIRHQHGGRTGISGRHERLLRAVRPVGRRRGERRHQVRREQPARRFLLHDPRRFSECRQPGGRPSTDRLGTLAETEGPPPAVRALGRWSDQEGQTVLLLEL